MLSCSTNAQWSNSLHKVISGKRQLNLSTWSRETWNHESSSIVVKHHSNYQKLWSLICHTKENSSIVLQEFSVLLFLCNSKISNTPLRESHQACLHRNNLTIFHHVLFHVWTSRFSIVNCAASRPIVWDFNWIDSKIYSLPDIHPGSLTFFVYKFTKKKRPCPPMMHEALSLRLDRWSTQHFEERWWNDHLIHTNPAIIYQSAAITHLCVLTRRKDEEKYKEEKRCVVVQLKTLNFFYKVSQPPESKLLSSFLAAMLGIPWDNQVLRITSHLAWWRNCRRPRRLSKNND